MKSLTTLLITICLTSLGLGADELWSNGRITPDQPFQAKVLGVKSGWGWDTIVLKEINGTGRYCLATLGNPAGTYKVIAPKNFDKKAMLEEGVIFLEPAVEVERFSWSMGSGRYGKIFGDEDVASVFHKTHGEQAAPRNR
jgi:hypothetical protein